MGSRLSTDLSYRPPEPSAAGTRRIDVDLAHRSVLESFDLARFTRFTQFENWENRALHQGIFQQDVPTSAWTREPLMQFEPIHF